MTNMDSILSLFKTHIYIYKRGLYEKGSKIVPDEEFSCLSLSSMVVLETITVSIDVRIRHEKYCKYFIFFSLVLVTCSYDFFLIKRKKEGSQLKGRR